MQISVASLLLAAVPFASAALKVVSPVPGSSASGGDGSLPITFADDGTQPPIAQIGTIQITLLAGGIQASDTMTVAAGAAVALSGAQATLPLVASKGPAAGTTNAFYLMIVQTPSTGGAAITTYSQRFTLTGMTGTWTNTAAQAAAAQAASNPADVPPGTNSGSSNSNSGGSNGEAGSGSGGDSGNGDPHPTGTWPAYSAQISGLTKYAPMQGKPGTKITQTNTAPLYAQSQWSVFLTMAPIPTWQTTLTASATFSAASRENTGSPVPNPPGQEDLEKWLNRWKD